MFVCVRVFCRKFLDNCVQKVSCAASVCGRDAVYLTQTERIELECIVHLLSGIDLVHCKYHRLSAAPEKIGDLLVIVGDASAGFHHEEHHMGFLYGKNHLLTDLFLKDVVRIGCVSAGVDNGKLRTAPFTPSIVSVARYACCFIYNRLSHPDKPVEKCGLSYIRAAHNR